MNDPQAARERDLMQRWVETWLQAGPELEQIRRREIEAIETREAVRQLLAPPARGRRWRILKPQA